MGATVVNTEIDVMGWEEAVAGSSSNRSSRCCSRFPGLLDPSWMARMHGDGLMVIVWEEGGTPVAAAPPAGFSSCPGVAVEPRETRQVRWEVHQGSQRMLGELRTPIDDRPDDRHRAHRSDPGSPPAEPESDSRL